MLLPAHNVVDNVKIADTQGDAALRKHILESISFYAGDLENHELKVLEPRVDFFKKHKMQIGAE